MCTALLKPATRLMCTALLKPVLNLLVTPHKQERQGFTSTSI